MLARKTGKPRALELETQRAEEQQELSKAFKPFLKELFGEDIKPEIVSGEQALLHEAIAFQDAEAPEEPTPPLLDKDGMPLKPLPQLSWLKENFRTKSACIRYLVSEQFEIKRIAKHLNLRYQHVRNVATSTLKRGPNEDWHVHPKDPEP
jgi:hypothetical protein